MRWITVRNPIRVIQGRGLDRKMWRLGIRVLNKFGAETKALNLIEKTLMNYPNQPEMHIEAGRLYLNQGQFDKSAWHFSKVNPSLDPADFISWLERLVDDDYDGVFTDRTSVLYALGTWYIQTGDPSRALEYFKSIRMHRAHPGIHNHKGLCYLALGRYEEALESFKIAARCGGLGPEVAYNAGLACVKLEDYEQALLLFERAQQRGFSTVDLLNNKGYCLYHLRRYDEATLCYEMARNLSPKDTVILSNLAASCEKQGCFGDAFDYYREAIRLDPLDAALRNSFGLCLQAMGKYSEALDQHDRAVDLDPTPLYKSNRALCLHRMGLTEQALAVYDDLLRSNPDDSRAWGLRAEMLMSLGRNEDATESLNKSLGLTG